MISPDQERFILASAYVPEHVVGLMTPISRGEPFLMDGYVVFAKDEWVILVGYPLGREFSGEDLRRVFGRAIETFRPQDVWFIAPEVPPAIAARCHERETDAYYTLPLPAFQVKAGLKRMVARASRALVIERGGRIERGHEEAIAEFLERERPNPRIERLFRSMPEYASRSGTTAVLTARDGAGAVSAFYVVDLAAGRFATYVVGCHSRKHHVVGASDVLFAEMVTLARDHGKDYIHLGIGVNEGIRKFKEKWGGTPSLRYEFCGWREAQPAGILRALARVWPC